jgi:hypothetical protein
MKKTWIGAVLLLIALAIWGCTHKTNTTATHPPATAPEARHRLSATACGTNLKEEWDHVYHPDRLDVKEQCKVVTGVIDEVRSEKDGDYHIRLRLDPGQGDLLNAKNEEVQGGDLVVEPICEHKVTQADAVASCENFAGGVKKPKKGQHVRVAGSYVHDTEAGHGWMEIHPAVAITAIPQ